MEFFPPQPHLKEIRLSSHREHGRSYVHVAGDYWMPARFERPSHLVFHDAAAHLRGVQYPVPASFRAIVHSLIHPSAVMLGFSALALHGLTYFVDGADTVLMHPVARSTAASSSQAAVVRRGCSPEDVWLARVSATAFPLASPAAATVQALRELHTGGHRFHTQAIHELDEATVQAIQLVDMVRRHLGILPDEIRAAARNRLSSRWLEGVLRKSSALADSPKETEMRLLVERFARQRRWRMVEQLPIYRDGRLITRFDLAFPDQKIALMYDGIHHGTEEQRHKDSVINAVTTIEGWKVLRISSRTLPLLLGWLEALAD